MSCLRTSVIAALIGSSSVAYGQSVPPTYRFDIPGEALPAALSDFARETGLQIGRFSDSNAPAVNANAVSGTYTAEAALGLLLAGSGYTYRFINERTIAIVASPAVPPVPHAPTTGETPASKHLSLFRRLAAIFAACNALAGPVCADEPKPAADTLQEIVVTAQKRKQNLQEVGTSITAFDSSALAQIGFKDATDIAQQVPGLQFNQFSADLTVFNIRGVSQNDFADHEEPPVAVYVDEAYVASPGAISGAIYDLERVEVLRGPQGTLFGRNATGGLIHYITKKPTDDLDGFIEATGGQFGEFNTRGAINAPLSDAIDARFSFATDEHKGLISNRIGPDTESQKQFAARLQLLFKLGDSGEFLLKLHGVHNDEVATDYSWVGAYQNSQGLGTPVPPNQNPWGTCNGCDLGGYRNPSSDPFNQAFDRPGGGLFQRSLYGATGRLTLKFGDVNFTSITDFQHMTKRYGEDADASPNMIDDYDTWQSYRQFSEEMRLDGAVGSVRWISGFYFLDMNSTDWATAALAPALGGPVGSNFEVGTRSWAIFGQGEWQIDDHWSAILGARFTEDEKNDNYTLAATSYSPQYDFNTTLYPDLAHRTWSLPSGKAEVDYKIDRDRMLYGSISRGVKGGGFAQPTAPPALAPTQMGFEPEKLTNYEVGFKSTLLGGRMRFNVDAFHYDYQNYQAFEQQGFVQVIANLHAKATGGEAELDFLPVRGLEFHLGVGQLNTDVFNVTLPAGQVTDRVLPQAPKWTLNALARYEWTAGGATWSVTADSKTNTSEYFETFNAPVDYQGGYSVANLRAGYTNPAGNVDIAVFCNNITDKFYKIYNLDLSVIGFSQSVYAPPRWAGVTVTYRWR